MEAEHEQKSNARRTTPSIPPLLFFTFPNGFDASKSHATNGKAKTRPPVKIALPEFAWHHNQDVVM